jgi:hypothetical protein
MSKKQKRQKRGKRKTQKWRDIPIPTTVSGNGQAHDGNDAVHHPAHYGGEGDPFETIKVLEAWLTQEEIRGFMIGNALKYLSRAGKKGSSDMLTDLKKARWYLDRIIGRLEVTHSLVPGGKE